MKYLMHHDELVANKLSESTAEYLVQKLLEGRGIDVHLYIAVGAKKTIESYCQYCKEGMPYYPAIAENLCEGMATAILDAIKQDGDYSQNHVHATLIAGMKVSVNKYRDYVTS